MQPETTTNPAPAPQLARLLELWGILTDPQRAALVDQVRAYLERS